MPFALDQCNYIIFSSTGKDNPMVSRCNVSYRTKEPVDNQIMKGGGVECVPYLEI
jgi:hypothetical protein